MLDDTARYWLGHDQPASPDVPAEARETLVWFASIMQFLARCPTTGELIAAISLYQQADGYHVGGTVSARRRGRGYGREALERVCRIAHQHLGMLRGVKNADEGGVHDADEELGESGANVGEVSGYAGKVSRR